ncbi:hypothetical protein [Cohnella panacarvi]|uniref:hypothetical protein n=1 Tax=Cohnella panacarvi TaxID=400776 RepID=UPI000479C868|nr:hypothetical protein [Cohnella panacarvi]
MYARTSTKSRKWKALLWSIALIAVVTLWYASVAWHADRSDVPSGTGIIGISDQTGDIELARRIIVYQSPSVAADA